MGRVAEMDEEDIGRYCIGGNNPPESSPWDAMRVNMDGVYVLHEPRFLWPSKGVVI